VLTFKNRQKIGRIAFWAIIFIGPLLSAISFTVVRNWDRQKLWVDFERHAENRYAALKREIESDIDTLSSVKAFFMHARMVDRLEFRDFTKPLLEKHPGIQALEWIPRISNEQQEEYVKAARKDSFKDFQITEQLTPGKMTQAGRRAEYFPVYFVEPYKGNELALGYDLASDPARNEALNTARDTGQIATTEWIRLVQEKEGQFGFLVFSPVYKYNMPTNSRQTRHKNILGFALGVFRINDIIARSLTYLHPAGIEFYIYENSTNGKKRILHFHLSRTGKTVVSLIGHEHPVPNGSLKITRTLNIADRQWQILLVPTSDYIAQGKTWQPWGVLSVGLLLTGLLAWFMNVQVKHTEKLTSSNELLLKEIAVRKKTEDALRTSQEQWQTTFDSTNDAIWLLAADGTILNCNKATETLLKKDCSELIGRHSWEVTHGNADPVARCPFLRMRKTLSRETLELPIGDRWLSITVDPITDEEGKIKGAVHIIRDITEQKQSADRLRKALGPTVHALAFTAEIRDPYTAGHQRRVADLARAIATEMGLTADQVDGIRMAGSIHDVGKISVPAEILSMPRKLTEIEFSLIKTHVQNGYEILKDIEFPWPVARMVLEHHERLDGSGYPNGLTGDKLLRESRIIAVADVVEAMASHRPYRPGLGIDVALDEISKNKGIIYDAEVADACLRIFREGRYKLAI